MEEKSFWEKIVEWFQKLLQKILQVLFPSDVLGMMGAGGADSGDSDSGTKDAELGEEERRRMRETAVERRCDRSRDPETPAGWPLDQDRAYGDECDSCRAG